MSSVKNIASYFDKKIVVTASNEIYWSLNKIFHNVEKLKKTFKNDPLDNVIISTLWSEVNKVRNELWHAGQKVSDLNTFCNRALSFLTELDKKEGVGRNPDITNAIHSVALLKDSLSIITRDFIPAAKVEKNKPNTENIKQKPEIKDVGGFAGLPISFKFPTAIEAIISPLRGLSDPDATGLLNELRIIFENGKMPGTQYFMDKMYWESLDGKNELSKKVEKILNKKPEESVKGVF